MCSVALRNSQAAIVDSCAQRFPVLFGLLPGALDSPVMQIFYDGVQRIKSLTSFFLFGFQFFSGSSHTTQH